MGLQAQKPGYPCGSGVDAVSQRWRQPSRGPGAVGKTRRAVTQVSAAPAAHGRTGVHGRHDSPAAVHQLHQKHDVHRGLDDAVGAGHCVDAGNGEPGGLAAGVEGQPQRLHGGMFHTAVDEPNAEREQQVNACASGGEQLARSFRRARHQRPFSPVQNQYRHADSFVRLATQTGGRLRLRALCRKSPEAETSLS
jgi:hypothetical protein